MFQTSYLQVILYHWYLGEKRSAVVTVVETLFDDLNKEDVTEFFTFYEQRKRRYIKDQISLS